MSSIQRARPVIELNLNVEEAMIETVDLLRTIRVQLEAITGTVNERLNRTFTDAGEDLTKIIHNVETLSSNLADSTGQLYHPIMFSLIFLLFLLVLAACLACILCKISSEIQRRKRNFRQPYEYLIKSGTSTTTKLPTKNNCEEDFL
uniref:t-SNARE coiled-coil homology domain-containing protein n=1 Tax=Meloidogyne hapla TaxID=6305 RepID=A0A1I8BL31_MELHA